MNFRAKPPVWKIERQRKASHYHNAPVVWGVCGTLRAPDRATALQDAKNIVGSSFVRVTPMQPEN